MKITLIRMDMPKSCSECILYDDDYDYPTCFATKHSTGYNFDIFTKRMFNCPLVTAEIDFDENIYK